jgi:hypothetical protein
MFEKILQLLSIACAHRKLSQPFTAGTSAPRSDNWDAVEAAPGHYVVCLDCGKKFAYDWSNMRVVR